MRIEHTLILIHFSANLVNYGSVNMQFFVTVKIQRRKVGMG